MLAPELFEQQPDAVAQGLANKRVPNAPDRVAEVAQLAAQRRSLRTEVNRLNEQMNKTAKQIGQLLAEKKTAEAEAAKAETGALKAGIQKAEDALRQQEAALNALLASLPNLAHPSVPVGHSPDDNHVHFVPAHQSLGSTGEPHWEVTQRLNLIDFEAGAKITGAGFPVYIGPMARLQRALISFFLDSATRAGFLEVQPPYLVNEASAYGTGQLPDKDGQMYVAERDGLYLIPTAEVPVTNLFRDDVLDEAQLPQRRCAYSPCFRREAGSYGAHVRGLNRLHQFDKVEIVSITTPENSYAELERMLEHSRHLLELLELPHRVLLLCTGDMTASSAKTYDLEVWTPGQQRWLEVSSVSNFEAYQARRLNLRYRPTGQKKTEYAHTLNGSALALPRIVAGLLENHRLPDGRIGIPAALQPWFGAEVLA